METKPILIDDGDTWKVLSSNGKDYYIVRIRFNGLACNCLGYVYRGTCRHIKLVAPLIKEGELGINSKLKNMESHKIPLAEIDNYLTDQELNCALAQGLVTIFKGKVVIL